MHQRIITSERWAIKTVPRGWADFISSLLKENSRWKSLSGHLESEDNKNRLRFVRRCHTRVTCTMSKKEIYIKIWISAQQYKILWAWIENFYELELKNHYSPSGLKGFLIGTIFPFFSIATCFLWKNSEWNYETSGGSYVLYRCPPSPHNPTYTGSFLKWQKM